MLQATASRALSFLGIGLVSSAGYLATMSIGVEWLALSAFAAAFLAFWVGTAISYLGNTLFTFGAALSRGTFARFFLVVLVGMCLNQAIAYALDRAGAHYVLIALAVFVVIPTINFVGHSFFTYGERRA